jgi:tetratricopeptide (TPR) repeat protein
VLGVAPEDSSALYELCDSDEPLVAGAANGIVSYFWENEGDLEGALKAARRMLEVFDTRRYPYLQAVAHSRISELCLQVERGDEARRHLLAVLPVLERLGGRSDLDGVRWWLVLSNLQLGAVDEAEHWLDQTGPPRADESVGTLTYGLGARAEILLARGEVEAGLRLWRRAVDLLRTTRDPIFGLEVDPGQEPWTLEVEAVTVVAHAQHGRLDLVQELTGELPDRLAAMLRHPVANPPPYLMELHVSGGLLVALAMVDLDRGARRRRAGHQVGGAAGGPGRALLVPAELPADHGRRPRPPRGRAGRPAGLRRGGVVVRRPGSGGPAGRRPGRPGGAGAALTAGYRMGSRLYNLLAQR